MFPVLMSKKTESCLEAILDTSAIIFAAERGVGLLELAFSVPESVCKVIIPSPVVSELRNLAKGRGSRSRAARAALEVIEAGRSKHGSLLEVIDVSGLSTPVDDVILLLAKSGQRVVITADRKMKKKACALGVRVYSVAKAYLSAR
uniref:PIN domain-containing protein n=1 Tax=Thermofilum pendens TaxID=2269 RepID=A0A7J3X6I7_THEPE